MAQSFTSAADDALASAPVFRRKVLITGSAGHIGSYFARHSHDHYELRLMIRTEDGDGEYLREFGDVVVGDITDLNRMKQICDGIDTVVHLAGDPSPNATWDDLLDANIRGTYSTFVAAKACRCRRVVFASSIHAVSGYPPDVQVKTSEPVNPGDLYGVSKCFGEALARYMAEKESLSAICLRIGAFKPPEHARSAQGLSMLDAWVSERDLCQLIRRCINVENLKFAILHGLSNNRFKRLDITDARELVGYKPEDDATEINLRVKGLHLNETVAAHNVTDGAQQSGLRKDLGG